MGEAWSRYIYDNMAFYCSASPEVGSDGGDHVRRLPATAPSNSAFGSELSWVHLAVAQIPPSDP